MSDDLGMKVTTEFDSSGLDQFNSKTKKSTEHIDKMHAEALKANAAFDKTTAALRKVARQKALKQIAADAAAVAAKTGDTRKATIQLTKAIAAMGDVSDKEAARVVADFESIQAGADRARKSIEQMRTRQRESGSVAAAEQFDVATRQVELAGDVESNLRTVGGAIGRFGGGGLEGSISTVAEIPAIVEALPRLKASLAGMPETINNMAASLGISTAALGGMAIGLGVVLVGVKLLTSALKKQAEAYQKDLDLRIEKNRATTLSSEELTQSIEDMKSENDELSFKFKEASADAKEYANSFQASDLYTVLGEDAEDRARKNAREATEDIAANEELIEAYEAELAARGGLTASVFEAANATRSQIELEQELSQLGAEASQTRLDEINKQREAIQAEIQALQESGNTAPEVADRIAELEGELDNLGRASQQVAGHINDGSAAMVDAAAQAAAAHEEAARNVEAAAKRAEQAQANYSKAVTNANKNLERSAARLRDRQDDATRKLGERISGAEEKALDKYLDSRQKIVDKANDSLEKAAETHRKKLLGIEDKFANAKENAIENRDFKALATAKRTRDKDLADAEKTRIETRDQVASDRQTALKDLRTQAEKERDTRAKEATKTRRELAEQQRQARKDLRTSHKQRISDARDALQAELDQTSKAASIKLQLEKDYWDRSTGLVRSALGSIGGGSPRNSSARNTTNNVTQNFRGATNTRVIRRAITSALREVG